MHTYSPCAGSTTAKPAPQQPFTRVAAVPATALLLGAGIGFVFAAVLSVTEATGTATGPWWLALVQAHGHIQLFGWAGLLIIGVGLHFLPRLRGAGLAFPALVPWLLAALTSGMLLRALCQPLAALSIAPVWRVGLALSGVLECAGVGMVIVLLVATSRRAAPIRTRPALWSVLPYVALAFTSLATAAVVNLVNVLLAAVSPLGIVPSAGDALNVTLGLFGFLIPMTLAMSVRSLPMYAGLDAFPTRTLRPTAFTYLVGLLLVSVGTVAGNQIGMWSGVAAGVGSALIGAMLIVNTILFGRLMRLRGRLPERVTQLAPAPTAAARNYVAQVRAERGAYGPFVALIASAFTWALLGGALLAANGIAAIVGQPPFVTLDAARHALTVGYIALLICGIAPRMLPGFSGGRIRSPHLVAATLWLGNLAAILRVGALLAAPALDSLGSRGRLIDQLAFGLSGPLGLALAVCLLVNVWPALWARITITIAPRARRAAASAQPATPVA
jgi:uncharacterized protein involved in response to NO